MAGGFFIALLNSQCLAALRSGSMCWFPQHVKAAGSWLRDVAHLLPCFFQGSAAKPVRSPAECTPSVGDGFCDSLCCPSPSGRTALGEHVVSHKSAGCCCCAVSAELVKSKERGQLPGAQGWNCWGRLSSLELCPVALPPHRHTGQQSEEERYARYKAGEHNCTTGGEDCLPSQEQGGVERNPSPDWDNADQVQIMMMISVSCWHSMCRLGLDEVGALSKQLVLE